MLFLETQDKADEADDIQQERDYPVESDERVQIVGFTQEHPEIINGRFSVEVIITREEEIPRVYPKPRKIVAPIHGVSDGNEFMVTLREGGEGGVGWRGMEENETSGWDTDED